MTYTQGTLFDFEAIYRPQRPLCSERKQGPYTRHERPIALTKPYIETNPSCIQSLIVADVDTPNAFFEYENANLPIPSWRVENVFNEHYHCVWSLTAPVCLTDAARRPPINLLARIEAGLRRGLHADSGYTGRIMRNPLSTRETATTWGVNNENNETSVRTYTLGELRDALKDTGLLPAAGEKHALLDSAVGRNVALFDLTRKWSYRAIKRYWGDPTELWIEVVHAYATDRNLSVIADEWGTPLPDKEVKHLARSIAKWTHRRFTPERFQEIQRQRGKKRAQQKRQQIQALIETAIEL